MLEEVAAVSCRLLTAPTVTGRGQGDDQAVAVGQAGQQGLGVGVHGEVGVAAAQGAGVDGSGARGVGGLHPQGEIGAVAPGSEVVPEQEVSAAFVDGEGASAGGEPDPG